MIVVSMALVLIGFVALVLGLVGVGEEPLRFVYGSIGACLTAAVFLAAGVLRARPSRTPAVVGDPLRPTWSGASPPEPGGTRTGPVGGEVRETHVQILTAQEAAREATAGTTTEPIDLGTQAAPGAGDDALEEVRFAQALAGLDLDPARFERLRGRFVTAERLAAASVVELGEVPGITPELAAAIHARLHAQR